MTDSLSKQRALQHFEISAANNRRVDCYVAFLRRETEKDATGVGDWPLSLMILEELKWTFASPERTINRKLTEMHRQIRF